MLIYFVVKFRCKTEKNASSMRLPSVSRLPTPWQYTSQSSPPTKQANRGTGNHRRRPRPATQRETRSTSPLGRGDWLADVISFHNPGFQPKVPNSSPDEPQNSKAERRMTRGSTTPSASSSSPSVLLEHLSHLRQRQFAEIVQRAAPHNLESGHLHTESHLPPTTQLDSHQGVDSGLLWS